MYSAIKRLKDEKWKLYLNSSNCGYCQKQITFLKYYLEDVNVIHCDDIKNKEECKKCKALPCWEKNGKLINGARLSVSQLENMLNEHSGGSS